MAQFNSLLVTGNSRFLNPINGNARNGIYYVKGTQTAATGAWTGNIPVPALYDGLTIMYYLPYAGSGNATLNLTLSDGTTTGAVNCYFRKNERLTTHFGSGYNFALTYHPAGTITIDGTATTDNRWIVNSSYVDGNDTAYYDRILYVRAKAGSNKVFPYTLVMRLPDGRWESIVTSASTATGKARNTHGFLFGQIAYINYNETFNENAVISDYRLWSRHTGANDYRYSTNIENNSTNGFTANMPVYLVGSISSDGLFYLDATWWTQTLPSTADGKIYLYVGDAYDYYRASFFGTGNVQAYVYTNGHLREYHQDAATVGGHTVAKDVPSNAVFTDNNTTYSMTRDGANVKLTPSSGSAQSVGLSDLINGLGEGTSQAQGADYLVAQYAGGGTTTTSYHRRSVSNVVNATVVKAALGTGSGTTKYLREDGTWVQPPNTNTTYTFANGTNGFTVTPSGGSAQTVTVTPSITNNVTGSGTSGYIAKFNGTNTITNGPAFGSATNTFLRNDGSWASPAAGSDVNVTQTATSTSANYEVLFSGTADNTTRTEGVRKNNNLTFNPNTGILATKHLSALYSGSKVYGEEVSACTTDAGGNWYPTVTLNGTNGAITATTLNGTTIGSSPKFTDANVTQTETSTSDTEYSLLFSGSQAGSSNKTEGARKDESFTYNPYNGTVTIGSGGASYVALSPYGIETPSMSVSDISSLYTPSKTSGNWSIGSDDGVYRIHAYRTGNVIQLTIILHGNGSAVSAGTNGFVGSISGGALPIDQVTLTGFYSSSSVMAVLDTAGSLTVRPFQNTTLSSSSRLYMTGTFICS